MGNNWTLGSEINLDLSKITIRGTFPDSALLSEIFAL
jgi:hypothetical protein